MTTQEPNYVGLAERIAETFRGLIEFDTVEHCRKSITMQQCKALADSVSQEDFLIAVGVALTFNITSVPPDGYEADDISDDYLEKHPEGREQLEKVVRNIEALKQAEDKEPDAGT